MRQRILLFACLAFVGCGKPNPGPDPVEPYAKVEFAFENEAYEGLIFHITDLQILNLAETEKYPNLPLFLGEVVNVTPQKFDYTGDWGSLTYYNLEDFDTSGRVCVAIHCWVETTNNAIIRTPGYVICSLPVGEIEADTHYKFIIKTISIQGAGMMLVDKFEILDW